MIQLDSLHVQNFRQLRDLRIESLGTVNLITGLNNAGKSSLLEAVYVYARRNDPFALREVVGWRGDEPDEASGLVEDEIKDLFHYFKTIVSDAMYDFQHPTPISIGNIAGDKCYTIAPKLLTLQAQNSPSLKGFGEAIESDSIDFTDFMAALFRKMDPSINSPEPQIGYAIMRDGREHTLSDTLYDKLVNSAIDNGSADNEYAAEYHESFLMNDTVYASGWDKISLTEKEAHIYDVMRTLNPDVERIDFKMVAKKRVAFVKLAGQKKPVRLSSMGEGVRRMFGIGMTIVNAENGFAVIDEFENGLHYTVQEQAWKWVFELAKTLNVQVFATTHSRDCVQAFAGVAAQYNQEDSRLIRLFAMNGKNKAIVYTPEVMGVLLEANQDPR